MTSGFFRAASSRAFATACALVAGMVSLRLYSRYLSPEIYGVILIATQIMSYLPLLDGGFRTTTSRTILAQSDPLEKTRLIRFCQIFYSWFGALVLLAALASMLAYAFSPGAKELGQPLSFFLILGMTGALAVVSSSQIGLLIALQAQSQVYLLAALGSGLYLASLWLSLRAGIGVWAFPVASGATVLGTYPVALWLIRRREPGIAILNFRTGEGFWALFHRLKQDAWSCFRSQIAIMLLYSVDVILVGIVCHPIDAAVYGVLSRLFSIMRNFLQSSSDVAWPIIAQKGLGDQDFNNFLVRANAWAYGSITGSVCATLIPFCHWYLSEAWTAPSFILYLMAARFLISGLAAPAAYFLYGLGEFKIITRYIERELLSAVLLAWFLGTCYGLVGIAWGFLLGTAFGTLWPIIRAYARRSDLPIGRLTFEMWSRTAVAFATSFTCASFFSSYFPAGMQTMVPGLLGLAAGVAVGTLFALLRREPQTAFSADKVKFQFLKSL